MFSDSGLGRERTTVALCFLMLVSLSGCASVGNQLQAKDHCDQQAMNRYPPVLREQRYQSSEPVEVYDGTETCTTKLDPYGDYGRGAIVEKCVKGKRTEYKPVTRVRTVDLNKQKREEFSAQCVPRYCIDTFGNPGCSATTRNAPQTTRAPASQSVAPASTAPLGAGSAETTVDDLTQTSTGGAARALLERYFGKTWVASPYAFPIDTRCATPYRFDFSEVTLVTQSSFGSREINVFVNHKMFSCIQATYTHQMGYRLSKEEVADIRQAFSELGAKLKN